MAKKCCSSHLCCHHSHMTRSNLHLAITPHARTVLCTALYPRLTASARSDEALAPHHAIREAQNQPLSISQAPSLRSKRVAKIQ